MAISVQNEQEAKVLAQAIRDGKVPSDRQAEAIAALREYNDQYHANRASAEDPSFFHQMKRKAQIAGEGLAIGVGDTLDMLATPFTGAAYLTEKALGTLEPGQKFFGDSGYADLSGAIDRSIDGPEPTTAFEKSLAGFSRVVGGAAGGTIGLGRALAVSGGRTALQRGAVRMGQFLSDQPKTQLAGAALGEGARQIAEGTGQSEGVQMAASLIGGFTPVGAQVLLRRAAGNAASRQNLADALNDADALDADFLKQLDEDSDVLLALQAEGLSLIDPKTGRISINALAPGSALDGVLRSAPGAARRLAKQAEEAENRIGAILRTIGFRVGAEGGGISPSRPFIDPKQAGEAAEKAVELAVANFRRQSSTYYNELDRQMLKVKSKWEQMTREGSGEAGELIVPIQRLMKEFDDVAPNEGIAAGQAHPMLAALKKQIVEAGERFGGKAVSYDDFVVIRKAIGNKLNNHNFFTDPHTGDLKRLFKAYSEDFEEIAPAWDQLFGTSVTQAGRKARDHYREGRELFDDSLAFITKKVERDGVAVEDVFQSIVTNAKNAPSRIEALMDAIDTAPRTLDELIHSRKMKTGIMPEPYEIDELAKQVTAEKLARKEAVHNIQAGIIEHLAKPLDSSDKAFSLGTFLTNWRRMRPASREAIFKSDPKTLEALERLSKIAERQVASNRAGARVSDITSALSQFGAVGTVGALAGGPATALVSIGGSILGANGMARLMTYRPFVRWLAESTGRSRNMGATLAGLSSMAQSNPEIAAELNMLVKGIGVLAGVDAENEERDVRLTRLTGSR